MANFWRIVKEVIEKTDVLLLLLDARMIDETRNRELEERVANEHKPLIFVVSKCDLVEKDMLERQLKNHDLSPSVFVSAKKRFGTTILREKILIEAKRKGIKGKVNVGVLGYPNVGKSSLINALKGTNAAKTSIMSGYTKGVQKVKADNRIMIFDTPGVIPYQERDPMKHSLIGTIDFTKTKDPDLVVMELMERFPGKIEKFYAVKKQEDMENLIEEIAIKKRILKKGGIPDSMRMARMILRDWQKGDIN